MEGPLPSFLYPERQSLHPASGVPYPVSQVVQVPTSSIHAEQWATLHAEIKSYAAMGILTSLLSGINYYACCMIFHDLYLLSL